MKKFWSIGGVVFLVFVGYLAILAISRTGKVKITVSASPSDSILRIDGKKAPLGNIYVPPGSHKFEITHQDFETATITKSIDSAGQSISLVAPADSQQSRDWLSKHPQESDLRQNLVATAAKDRGQSANEANPFISQLPVTNYILGEGYSIDFGPPKSGSDQPKIYITAGTPSLRLSALGYIKAAGYNPADMDITFVNVTTGFGRGDN
jgi:hypothetical protein